MVMGGPYNVLVGKAVFSEAAAAARPAIVVVSRGFDGGGID